MASGVTVHVRHNLLTPQNTWHAQLTTETKPTFWYWISQRHSTLLRTSVCSWTFLEYYGIHGHHLNWMQSWLLKRTQQMVLKGGDSEKSNVKSGVPQGTVLGPLCFLLYINDMGNNISSNLKLFADDTLLYGLVHNTSDALHLSTRPRQPCHLGTGMTNEPPPSKCYFLRIYRIKF